MKNIKQIIKEIFTKIKSKKFKKKEVEESSLMIEENKEEKKLKVSFKKSRFPKFIVSNKRSGLVVSLSLLLPVLALGAGVSLGIMNAKDDEVKKVVEVTTNKDNLVVYLLDKDNLIVPISLQVDSRINEGERYIDSFNFLKQNNGINISELRGYIPDSTSVKSFTLEGSNLLINLSKEFLEYSEKYDYKMMQAITYTYLEFDDVESLTYLVEGEPLGRLKHSGVTLPNQVSRDIGINQQFTPIEELVNVDNVTIYYQKNYSSKSYLVPVTQSVSKGENKVESVYNALKETLSPVLGLQKIKDYSLVDLSVKPTINEEEVLLSLLDEAKVDEVTIKRDVYELLKLTLEKCNIDKKVSLLVEGEACQVDGYYEEDSSSVSTYIYNSVAI